MKRLEKTVPTASQIQTENKAKRYKIRQLSLKTNAATFIETLGTECGRFLYTTNEYQITNDIKLQNITKKV